MSHLSEVRKRCCTVTSSPSLSLWVPQRRDMEHMYKEHILLLSEMLQSAGSGPGLEPVGMDGTGIGSPDLERRERDAITVASDL